MSSALRAPLRTLLLVGLASLGLVLTSAVERSTPGDADGPVSATDPTRGDRTIRSAESVRDDALLAWTSGGLLEGAVAGVAALDSVAHHTVVRGDRADLTGSWDADGEPVDVLADGWIIPLDAFAIDPGGYADFVPEDTAAAVAGLGDGEALLGATSAALRGLDAGATVEVGGELLEVVDIVADVHVGAAELVVDHATGERIGVTHERFVLVRPDGDPAATARDVAGALAGERPTRVSAVGDLPLIRHGSGVLPQAEVKERFGEFSLEATSTRRFRPDPGWVEQHIRTERVPILGRITCHRDFFPAVRGALAELEDRGLGHLVVNREYSGCWVPRFTGARRTVSRHAWGVAIDFNAASNPYGAEPDQDPRLVDVMQRWGMNWGGEWLVPDAMHFEHERWPDSG